MKLNNSGIVGAVILVLGSIVAGPVGAQSQQNKNNARNIGIGLGGAAAYELLKGKGTNALILGAGAAVAGKSYEDQRKSQSRQNNYHRVYSYSHGVRTGYSVYDGNNHRLSSYRRNSNNGHYGSGYHRS